MVGRGPLVGEPRLERRYDRALVFVQDELFGLWAVQGFHQLGNVGTVSAVFAGGHDVGVRRVSPFNEQRIFGGVEFGFDFDLL